MSFIFGEQLTCSQQSSPLGHALKSFQEFLPNVWVWDARPTTSQPQGASPGICAPLAEQPGLTIGTKAVHSGAWWPLAKPIPTAVRCLWGSPGTEACQRPSSSRKGPAGNLGAAPLPAQDWPKSLLGMVPPLPPKPPFQAAHLGPG